MGCEKEVFFSKSREALEQVAQRDGKSPILGGGVRLEGALSTLM